MLISSTSLILCYFERSNKIEDNFRASSMSFILIKLMEPNSQVLVFYSEKRHRKIQGYATNWDSTGYFEAYYSMRK
jgi:hypothetical protein